MHSCVHVCTYVYFCVELWTCGPVCTAHTAEASPSSTLQLSSGSGPASSQPGLCPLLLCCLSLTSPSVAVAIPALELSRALTSVPLSDPQLGQFYKHVRAQTEGKASHESGNHRKSPETLPCQPEDSSGLLPGPCTFCSSRKLTCAMAV